MGVQSIDHALSHALSPSPVLDVTSRCHSGNHILLDMFRLFHCVLHHADFLEINIGGEKVEFLLFLHQCTRG